MMQHPSDRSAGLRRWVSAALIVMTSMLGATAQAAAPRQPRQPLKGPGGSETAFGGIRVTTGGSGNDAWELLEPVDPTPPSAPLVVVEHGYYEFSGYSVNGALARHTALKGNVVIYPRWQTSVASPCPGPIDIGPCISSTVAAIHGAIAFLRAHPGHVQPRLDDTSYFGFSFGGIITADMLGRYRALGLPKPRAVFLDDPHDGALTGPNEPALDNSLAGIPSTTKLVCHAGADGVISQTDGAGQSLADASCNAVFPKIGQIARASRSIVLTSDDSHGRPVLSAIHGVCAGPGSAFPVDAYDWGFCWRSFDALRACALYGADCRYALGDTPQNRYIGTWSDGVPIIGLKIQDYAPIRILPTPSRQPAPPAGQSVVPPRARLKPLPAVVTSRKRIALSGTASGDNGVAFVEVAIVRRIGPHCDQMSSTGRFVALPSCDHPTSFLFATGTTKWFLKLPVRLRRGSYGVFARAVDAFAQSEAYPSRSSTAAFEVATGPS